MLVIHNFIDGDKSVIDRVEVGLKRHYGVQRHRQSAAKRVNLLFWLLTDDGVARQNVLKSNFYPVNGFFITNKIVI